MNSLEKLNVIYKIYCDRGGARSKSIDQFLKINENSSVTIDDERNEADYYKTLYGGSYDLLLTQLYDYLLNGMRGREIDDCGEELAGLRFLAGCTMRAVMLYNAQRNTPLAMFANEFDRLDLPEIRQRLYQRAQIGLS